MHKRMYTNILEIHAKYEHILLRKHMDDIYSLKYAYCALLVFSVHSLPSRQQAYACHHIITKIHHIDHQFSFLTLNPFFFDLFYFLLFPLQEEDERSEKTASQNAQNFQHFDHSFKGELHTSSGSTFVNQFGECTYANRAVQVMCKGSSFEVVEDVGISLRRAVTVNYKQVGVICTK